MNLLTETLLAISDNGYTPGDIIYIGVESGYSCEWDDFARLANREYDDGYGSQEVASDLRIIFNDGGRLARSEYDGSEWWAYTPPFKLPVKTYKIQSLFVSRQDVGWLTLEKINQVLEDYEQNRITKASV